MANKIFVLLQACLLITFFMVLTIAGQQQQQDVQNFDDMQLETLKTKYLPSEYAKSNFTLEDAKRLLRQKCKKSGINDPNIYENLEKASVKLMECANNIANITEILAEIEMARPNGELDVVFQKYCNKQTMAEQCLDEFNAQLLPCLTLEERAQNIIMMRIIKSLLGFICYKNGDQIALFIAEEGPECIQMHKENIGNCMNSSFSAYLPKVDLTSPQLSELPDLLVNPKQCIDLYDFEECVLSYLETCNDITPANIIESMFRYVKNETKCDTQLENAQIAKHLHNPKNTGNLHRSLFANIIAIGVYATLLLTIKTIFF